MSGLSVQDSRLFSISSDGDESATVYNRRGEPVRARSQRSEKDDDGSLPLRRHDLIRRQLEHEQQLPPQAARVELTGAAAPQEVAAPPLPPPPQPKTPPGSTADSGNELPMTWILTLVIVLLIGGVLLFVSGRKGSSGFAAPSSISGGYGLRPAWESLNPL